MNWRPGKCGAEEWGTALKAGGHIKDSEEKECIREIGFSLVQDDISELGKVHTLRGPCTRLLDVSSELLLKRFSYLFN